MAKLIRRYTCSYLYTDGTLIQCFEEERGGVKIGETADVTFNYCKVTMKRYLEDGGCEYVADGRVVFHRYCYEEKGPIDLARGGRVEVSLPSIRNGSPHSQEKGLAVQYLTIRTVNGYQLHWTEVPTVLSGQFTPQEIRHNREREFLNPDDVYQGRLWAGSFRIWKIIDLRPKPPARETGAATEVRA